MSLFLCISQSLTIFGCIVFIVLIGTVLNKVCWNSIFSDYNKTTSLLQKRCASNTAVASNCFYIVWVSNISKRTKRVVPTSFNHEQNWVIFVGTSHNHTQFCYSLCVCDYTAQRSLLQITCTIIPFTH